MKLDFIPIDKLIIAKTNLRHGKTPDVSDILPTVRARGVLQSLVVRPHGDTDLFEIIAGSRRHRAATIVVEERRAGGEGDPGDAMMLPCAILDAGDDAAAVEASLIENHARLDPDEVTQWEGFVRLVKEGRSVEDIAATFGMPDLKVKRILALGNLLPRIRNLFRRAEIDVATVRHLTLASKARQRDWLALWDDPDAHCPTGHQLKRWLFGGASIAAKNALFDIGSYKGQIVADLFGEDGYFAETDLFWDAQNAAVAARQEAYLAEGWQEVVILDADTVFQRWQHEKAPKKKGGRVYIEVRSSGEVTFHEGYVTEKEARRIAKGETVGQGIKIARPELSSTLANYIDLHRHAAARAALLTAPGFALRMMVAHAIIGSHLWGLRADALTTRNDATAETLELSPGEFLCYEQRRDILAALALSAEESRLVGATAKMGPLLARLMAMPDEAIMGLVALIMGETLATGHEGVELVGLYLRIDMADWWEADDVFLEHIRDRQVLLALVAEVAGPVVAEANKTEKTKVLKQIIRDYVAGNEGRTRAARWVPRWMQFPPSAYTDRGGVAMIAAHARAAVMEEEDNLPDAMDEGAEVDASEDDEGEAERLAA